MKFYLAVILLISAICAISGKNEEICSLPSDVGPCRAHQPHYFFNSATKQCEQFFYGGCRGNANRFKTQQECEETCL